MDPSLVEYPHGVVKEQVYIKALSNLYKRFLDNDKKEVRLHLQLLDITELQQLKMSITARH